MDQLDLARIQFATTSIYHFFFVPVTMGLALLVAVLHTRWHRSGNPELRRLTKFFGTLMLISDQRRRRHRPGAGIPVRDGLVGLFAVRR